MARLMPDLPAPPAPVGPDPRRVSLRRLLAEEIRRLRTLVRRYPWESSVGLLAFAFMFVVFAVIGRTLQGPFSLFSGNLKSLALLYTLWTLCITSITSAAGQIGAEAATGVLENLFLSTAPVVVVLQVRAMVQAAYGVLTGALLLSAFCLGTRWLPSPAVFATLLLVGLACCVASVGLALVFAGVALLSKRATTLAMPVNFLCIVAMATPHAPQFDRLGNPLLYLPLVAGAGAVRQAVEDNRFDAPLCLVAFAAAVPCVLLGRAVLARCAMACRRAGTTSLY